MILVNEEIKEAVNSGEIEISSFSEEYLQPASYDLRVGEEGYTLIAGKVMIEIEGMLEIQPGDFALVMTHEKVRLPLNVVGRFGLRSKYTRMGLLATVGPQVDPGFEGKLVVGLVSFTPQLIKLPYMEPFCSLELDRLSRQASIPYNGPYQGQEHITDKITNVLPKEPLPLAVMLVRQLAAASPLLKTSGSLTSLWPQRVSNVFELEKRAFERLRPQLLKTHRGQYVVIREEKTVLFGLNKAELAKQAYEKFGYGPLYIGLVEEEPEVVHFPTPKMQVG